MVASEGAEVGPAEDEGGNPEAEFREELLGVTGRGLHRVRNSTNSGSERGHVSGALLEVGGKGPLWEPLGPPEHRPGSRSFTFRFSFWGSVQLKKFLH